MGDRGKKDNLTRPSAKEFGQFVTALARRYGDQVATWSIWNEPNQPQFLLPAVPRAASPYSPQLYRGLYRAATSAIRSVAANRRDKILIGETSPRGNENIVAPAARSCAGCACLDARYKQDAQVLRGCRPTATRTTRTRRGSARASSPTDPTTSRSA